MFAKAVIFVIVFGLVCGAARPTQGQDNVTQDAASDDAREVGSWLAAHGQSPADYVVSLFETADVVLIGEIHEVADNCEFVASIVEPLYKRAGVRVLGLECVRSALNDRVRELILADDWDDAAAVDLFREAPWPTWGYREYVDILRAAWRLNRSLDDGAEPFMVVGIDDDWRQIELLGTDDRAERFRIVMEREDHMTAEVERASFKASQKAAVLIGYAHTVFVQGQRLGARLRGQYGDRVTHLVLHHEITAGRERSSITRVLEEGHAHAGGEPVAFRVEGSPIAALRDPNAGFTRVLGPDAGLGTFVEHYAVLSPVDEQRPVTWIPGFIRAERLAEAIEVGERLRWLEKGAVTTVEEANEAYAERLRRR